MNPKIFESFLSGPWLSQTFFLFLPLVVTALSFFSGWASLATRYQARQEASGERFRFVSGSMGFRIFPVSYGNCLFVSVNEQGMHLSVFFLFRLFSPPLLLPWSEMETVEKKRYFFMTSTVIRLRGQWPEIRLMGAAGEAVLAAYARADTPKRW